jgi:hypothetical protein
MRGTRGIQDDELRALLLERLLAGLLSAARKAGGLRLDVARLRRTGAGWCHPDEHYGSLSRAAFARDGRHRRRAVRGIQRIRETKSKCERHGESRAHDEHGRPKTSRPQNPEVSER